MKGKIILSVIVAAFLGFGYSQYASATHTSVELSEAELIQDENYQSKFRVLMKFENPSLIGMKSGHSQIFIKSNQEIIGEGVLEPFSLGSRNHSYVNGTFYVDKYNYEGKGDLTINGKVKFDLGLTDLEYDYSYQASEVQKNLLRPTNGR